MSDKITEDKIRKMNSEIEKAASAILESSFAGPSGSAGPDKCPVCREQRVPQYDIELKMAHAALNDWQIVARNLYKVMSLRKTELRRVTAENAYTKLARDYNVE